MLIDSYHSKQYQAISRKEATVQVPLSTRTVFSLMIMIMIIEYTTYPILASSTVLAMVHPPRGSYEEMLASVTWTQSKRGRATIFNLFNQRMLERMMKWCRWIILILCYCMMVLTCDVWWYMICPNTTVACLSPCLVDLSRVILAVLIKLSSFPLPFLICFFWIQQSAYKIIPDLRFFTPRPAKLLGMKSFQGDEAFFKRAINTVTNKTHHPSHISLLDSTLLLCHAT